MGKRITVSEIKKTKGYGKVTMLTCYDYTFATLLDEAGVDIVLVGDSLANVVLGMEETRGVSIEEMINHTRAVALGVKRSLVVADMPYLSYQKDPSKALFSARAFMAAGAQAVKIEWFNHAPTVIRRLIKHKVPVMGHIGLTPQTAHVLGGYKVQGKTREPALQLIEQARLLQKLGVFSLVIECVPYQLAKVITSHIKVPTIGIGAGKFCDGQVLVLYDLLGLYTRVKPRFVRQYRNGAAEVKKSICQFAKDIKTQRYPLKKESFSMNDQEWQLLRKVINATKKK